MTDPRTDAIVQTAARRVQAAVSDALDRLAMQVGPLAMAATSNQQRQTLMNADSVLQRHTAAVLRAFSHRLHERLQKTFLPETAPSTSGGLRSGGPSDWSSLTLVDNAEVERGVHADRLGQALGVECAEQLAELDKLLSDLLDDARLARHALRPNQIAGALLEALAEVEPDPEVVQMLGQHAGRVLAPQIGSCYAQISTDLRAQGIQPRALSVQRPRSSSGRSASSATTPGQVPGDPQSTASAPGGWVDPSTWSPSYGSMGPEAHARAAQALGAMFGVNMPVMGGEQPPPMRLRGEAGAPPLRSGQLPAAPSGFQALLQRINQEATGTAWAHAPTPLAGAPEGDLGTAPGFAGRLMAANLIRAHRDELVRASGGAALDQMVIDIVAALFDQVLSDPKVAPEMARQIARLQMPVLRVALADMGFFHSRKHPVRRFVNRIATLSVAYESLQEGPGRTCLEQVTALVDDIVEGDFDRMGLYEAKLAELERHIESGHARESAEHAAVQALLSGKEADLRVQQRYMQSLKRELAEVTLPDFVRDFLTQIWSQVQVMASARDGAGSELAARMRKAGHDLALSVQPKGTPALRKAFLMTLPQLMKDLTEGLALIQWPEEAKQAFFSQLLPAHAESLKQAPHHDLTQRLLEQQLSKVERLAIPSREEAANDPVPAAMENLSALPVLTVASALSPEEAQQAGFVPEATVPTDTVDINLDEPAGEVDPSLTEVDINLDSPPPPAAGLQLVHHIQKGTAYQMLMQGEWKRVRLTWVSEGRTFFIFTQGHQHKRTISLTARTLAKMCDTGRFKAFEQAELLERATMRARRQLAALAGGGRSAA
ncbi:DUF1631 family protein [uncultured Aquabacterium sp.]|uniref:DUF1631 family protein n=1 Tax=uncultured Aquabacterium sp. TaxID=158753 RepID=UPI0025CEF54B|nr:DUF1631 family protein [uncultured Aquabacterium sp.]